MVTGCLVKSADLALCSKCLHFVQSQVDVGSGKAGPELIAGSALKELSVWGRQEGKAHSASSIRAWVCQVGAQEGGDTHQSWDQADCPPELLREEAETLSHS